MIEDLRAIITNSKLRRPVTRFIECILIAAIYANMSQSDAGEFLELPSHTSPVDGAHNRREVRIVGIFGKQLREYFVRTFESFRCAALPMNGGIAIVQPLNSIPGEGSAHQRFLRHVALPRRESAQYRSSDTTSARVPR